MATGDREPDVGRAPQAIPRHVVRDQTYLDAAEALDIPAEHLDVVEMRVEYVICRIPEICRVLAASGYSVIDDDDDIPLRFFFTYDNENVYLVSVERK